MWVRSDVSYLGTLSLLGYWHTTEHGIYTFLEDSSQTESRQIDSALDLGLREACVMSDTLPVITESLLLMSVLSLKKNENVFTNASFPGSWRVGRDWGGETKWRDEYNKKRGNKSSSHI